MKSLNIYLNFGGNCREAIDFYVKHLGAKVESMSTFGDIPGPATPPPGLENGILHARFTIAGALVMASDAPPDRYQPMRSAYLSLTCDANDEAERIYSILSDGAEIFMPLDDTFFAERFAMLRDRFGVSWMLLSGSRAG